MNTYVVALGPINFFYNPPAIILISNLHSAFILYVVSEDKILVGIYIQGSFCPEQVCMYAGKSHVQRSTEK